MTLIHQASTTAASSNEKSYRCLKRREFTEFKEQLYRKPGDIVRERDIQLYIDAEKEKEN